MRYKIPESKGLTSPMGSKLSPPERKTKLPGPPGVSGTLHPPKRSKKLSSPIGGVKLGQRTRSKKFKEVLG
jgi:hypothetical protein